MKTSILDFTFKKTGSGSYKVTYQSPVTGREWSRTVLHMPLIDCTHNDECPKQKDLDYLKYFCKGLR